ncbi:Protein of unknown function [Pyronema omphalodes CBS 100304]|uniref:Uncharacterized protein n=1 Tax=Pyronema omphalodes (strain CBS 100304) TaxID=1076935 RepID=U4L289_PYROM|nr:Protein of unknown function [Pyronema omphalodes CBS 100304]
MELPDLATTSNPTSTRPPDISRAVGPHSTSLHELHPPPLRPLEMKHFHLGPPLSFHLPSQTAQTRLRPHRMERTRDCPMPPSMSTNAQLRTPSPTTNAPTRTANTLTSVVNCMHASHSVHPCKKRLATETGNLRIQGSATGANATNLKP